MLAGHRIILSAVPGAADAADQFVRVDLGEQQFRADDHADAQGDPVGGAGAAGGGHWLRQDHGVPDPVAK